MRKARKAVLFVLGIGVAAVNFGCSVRSVATSVPSRVFREVHGLRVRSYQAVATFNLITRGETFVSPHGHSWEASSFYLIASLAVALLGPGFFSLDALLFRRRSVAVDRAQTSNAV
jgi:hypothetical protein